MASWYWRLDVGDMLFIFETGDYVVKYHPIFCPKIEYYRWYYQSLSRFKPFDMTDIILLLFSNLKLVTAMFWHRDVGDEIFGRNYIHYTGTYWFKTQKISWNLFHIQIEYFIIGFSSGKHKPCIYQNGDSHISQLHCQSILWTGILSYRHLVCFHQHIQHPNFIVVYNKYIAYYMIHMISYDINHIIAYESYGWNQSVHFLSNHFLVIPTSVQWPSTWQVNGPPESPSHESRTPVKWPAHRFRSSGSIPSPSNSLHCLFVRIWIWFIYDCKISDGNLPGQ